MTWTAGFATTAILAPMLAMPSVSVEIPEVVQVLEGQADGRPVFVGPIGIRCAPDGFLYVVDDLAHRIVVFDREGHILRLLGRHGAGPGELLWPDAIDVALDGTMYVADTGGNRIQVWSADGRFVRSIGRAPRLWRIETSVLAEMALAAMLGIGAAALWIGARLGWRWALMTGALALVVVAWLALRGPLPDKGLRNPRDVRLDADGRLFVADFGGHAIRIFDAATGRLSHTIGRRGNLPGELNSPVQLAIAGDEVYVSDSRNHRVQVFSKQGDVLRAFGQKGSGPNGLDTPHGIAIDAAGHIYVADHRNHRVQVFTRNGTYVRSLGREGAAPGELNLPLGLCIDAAGLLHVVDSGNHRVQTWRLN
jgi:tripartite motif-containing protein 71